MTPAQEITWTSNRFESLTIGGTWAVPRSGLVFTRTDVDVLTLTGRMFHIPTMPLTPDKLWDVQTEDFECIATRARAAGITCIDKTSKPPTTPPHAQL